MDTAMTRQMYKDLGIDGKIFDLGEQTACRLADRFAEIDRTAEYNQLKVVGAMQKCRASEACLYPTSGYGYNDVGRDTLEEIYAAVFHTEAALVRPQIACGTHALALALAGNLRPGDELLSPVGKPYDTLEEVIGIRPSKGSLAEYGVILPAGGASAGRHLRLSGHPRRHHRENPDGGNPEIQRLSDPSHFFRAADRRADRFYPSDQTGCDLHGGQLLRRVCGDH